VAKEKIVMIPNGASVDIFTREDQKSYRVKEVAANFKYVFGYVGTHASLRRLGLLITSLSLLGQDRNVGLILVGDGTQKKELEKLERDLCIEDRVLFIGLIP
jgi:glycosyltransferase involved in cell wall biosynthesis